MSTVGTVNPIAPRQAPAAGGVGQLRDVAGRIVGSVFYGTLLKSLRQSGMKGEYGHGGRGEEVFQAQLDQVLAEEAGRSRGFALSEAIVKRFEGLVRARARAAAGDGGDS